MDEQINQTSISSDFLARCRAQKGITTQVETRVNDTFYEYK